MVAVKNYEKVIFPALVCECLLQYARYRNQTKLYVPTILTLKLNGPFVLSLQF